MPEQQSTSYKAIERQVTEQFLRLSSKQATAGQYRMASVANHTHNNIDSPPVIYSTLKDVQNYLVANTVILTSAQVKALHTTPIVLVKNPGPRGFNFVEGVAGRLVYSGTAYTGVNNLEFRYTNGSGLKVCADMPGGLFLNATASAYSYSPWQVDYNRNTDSNFTPVGGDTGNNGQVVVSVPNANPATGNSTVILTVYYRVTNFTS